IRDYKVTGVQTCALPILPVGIAVGHYGRGGILAINVSNVGRAIPSFAVLVLAAKLFGFVSGPRVLGFGAVPAFVALVALAIPPRSEERRVGKGCRLRWRP